MPRKLLRGYMIKVMSMTSNTEAFAGYNREGRRKYNGLTAQLVLKYTWAAPGMHVAFLATQV